MDLAELADLRREYRSAGLAETDLDPDPVVQFARWFAAWSAVAVGDANAMVLATATPDGRPSARTVLLKGVVGGGFVFYTNYASRKGRELDANPRAALLFPWHAIGRQLIVEGAVARLPAADSDAYWATRPPGSRLGAAASPQSSVVPDRATLDRRLAELAAAHPGGDIPRPAHWGGYRLEPDRFELWQGGENRLHDRLVYRRVDAASAGAGA
ncbi:MAG TPA: pyridoxamine 5'-phosphate oxidase, partial [Acidimicrobiales bacterium]